jgi:hypothetical protein
MVRQGVNSPEGFGRPSPHLGGPRGVIGLHNEHASIDSDRLGMLGQLKADQLDPRPEDRGEGVRTGCTTDTGQDGVDGDGQGLRAEIRPAMTAASLRGRTVAAVR